MKDPKREPEYTEQPTDHHWEEVAHDPLKDCRQKKEHWSSEKENASVGIAMIRNGRRHGLAIREAFTYTTLDREVAPPQPISIIANVASEMTNLALCQRNTSFSSYQESVPHES